MAEITKEEAYAVAYEAARQGKLKSVGGLIMWIALHLGRISRAELRQRIDELRIEIGWETK